MSENQANPGSEGTNVQPPVAGQSPESGAEVGSQTPQQPAIPPASNAPAPSSPYQTGYDPSVPWMRPTEPAPAGDAPQTGQAPTVYSAQIPSYGSQNPSTPAYGQTHAYGQPYGAGSPYASSSQYDPGSPGSAPTGAIPTFPGQTWTPVGTTPPGTSTTNAPVRRGGMGRGVLALLAALVVALVAGGVGGFVGYAMHTNKSNSPVQSAAQADPANAARPIDRSSLASIAKAIQPTVVSVKTQVGEGSGVVISADGYIVTNNHVVATATGSSVQVTFNSGKILTAKIVGTDPKTDLAVIKTDTTGLTYAAWEDSNSVQVGDTVLAIGSPLGLQGSVTAGIVSALHRTITVGGDQQQSQFQAPAATTTIGDAIQTDAPINPGNSGGALVDTNGKVIGINSAIATSGSNSTGNIGVGFAISSNKAKSVSDQLIKGGKVSHPYLGVSVGEAQDGGAQIQTVESGSPAANAGIKEGDVVTKVGDRAITTSEDLVGAIQSSSPGAKMTLTVMRNGSESTITVTVGDQP